MENNTEKKIEAILFYSPESISIKEISRILSLPDEDIVNGIEILRTSLNNRGISLVENNNRFSLATSPEFGPVIETMVRQELEKDLSQASLETLSVVLYKFPVSKKEIEYIRGVNSSFSIRNLLIRGLIERQPSQLDERIYLYRPTKELFLYLGISKIEEMPEWLSIKKEIEKLVVDADLNEESNKVAI